MELWFQMYKFWEHAQYKADFTVTDLTLDDHLYSSFTKLKHDQTQLSQIASICSGQCFIELKKKVSHMMLPEECYLILEQFKDFNQTLIKDVWGTHTHAVY